ncbi:hypothetical protein Tco_1217051 [Tanacetum coccineum]
MSNGVPLVGHFRNSGTFSDSKHFVCLTCQKCVFNANHDDCITKFLKEVNSRAKVQSPKTRNNNKPVEPKNRTQKPGRHIAIGQRFSLNKSSAVHEKPNTPRSCLRWIPSRKMFIIDTTKVDSEPPNGSNEDITNPYECDQTLNGFKEFKSDDNERWRLLTTLQASFLKEKKGVRFSALYLWKKRNLLVFDHSYQQDSCFFHARSVINSGLVPQPPSPTPNVPPTKNDWDTLFCLMFDEYFNPSLSVAQPVLVVAVQEPVVSTGTPSSTRIDQDTPSTSTSQTIKEAQSHVIPTSVEEDDHGIEVAHMDNVTPLFLTYSSGS